MESEEVQGRIAGCGRRVTIARWVRTKRALSLTLIRCVVAQDPELSHLALQSGSFQA